MNNPLVPPLDPTPIPAPGWLFHALLVFTFVLHALFMNLTLGGTILAAIARLTARGGADDHRAVLAQRLVGINTFGISLTITTGVAPLLFVQVLYPQFFYTATILLGWIWFAFLGLLMLGYYAVYAYKYRAAPPAPASGRRGAAWLVVAALSFLLIAMTHVAVSLMHAQPDKWAALAADPWAVLADPAYWPRLLHFVLAALGFSGLVIAWWAARRARRGEHPELDARVARYGWRWALWTTALQIVDGFVLLMVLPREVLAGLMQGGAATLGPLVTAIALGMALLMMLARVAQPVESPATVNGALALMTATIAVMAVTRHQVRALYLAPATAGLTVAEAPQWGNFALFALLLVAGLATVAYMVGLTVRERSAA